MEPNAAERRHLERQITFARPIFMVLALVDLLELKPAGQSHRAMMFVAVYLGAALVLALVQNFLRKIELQLPLLVDLAALAAFLTLTPSVVAFWFIYLFVAFAAGIRWGLRRAVVLAGGVTLALLVRTAIRGPVHWPVVFSWVALSTGTFAAGVGLAFLGERNRRHAAEHGFLARLTSLLQVDQGLAESLRQVLDELARAFACEDALLTFRDADIERIFVWQVRAGQAGASARTACLSPAAMAICWIVPMSACAGMRWKGQERDSAGTVTTDGDWPRCRACLGHRAKRSTCARCWPLPSISQVSRLDA